MPTSIELKDGDKTAFERAGVVCLRNVIDHDGVEALRKTVERQRLTLGRSHTAYDFESVGHQIWDGHDSVTSGEADRFDVSRMKSLIDTDMAARPLLETGDRRDSGQFLYDVAAWKSDIGVRRVAFDSHLPALISGLLDAEYLCFWEDTTFCKAPNTKQKTAFHQDLAYFQIDGDQCIIVWIPLDVVSRKNGAMEYVRGSHLWDDIYAPNVLVSQTTLPESPHPRCPDIEGERCRYDIVSFDVEPGDVIIHHVKTVHGSGGNMSSRPRRAMSLRYCGEKVRYFDRPGAIKQVNVRRDLKDGDRLFSLDYPIVWPKPWPGLALAELYPDQAQALTQQSAAA
ncbi:MAG: phytanoyl-CoA dioxygenase family protein [Sphingomonadales bacterium]